MPELPEVETVRRQLHERLQGATLVDVDIWRSGREFPTGKMLTEALIGRRVNSIDRRAKLLIWHFENNTALTAHLKMTGRFVFVEENYTQQKHDRIRFVFNKNNNIFSLIWSDIRQFGFVKHVEQAELEDTLKQYGPEPLDASIKELADRLALSSKRSVKVVLLDQSVIAGVGNIYADEALYRAAIRPTCLVSELTAKERLRLVEQIQIILQESIDQQGTSANDYVDTRGERGGFLELLRVYGREGQECRACRSTIKRMVIGQRGTHYCPKCQK